MSEEKTSWKSSGTVFIYGNHRSPAAQHEQSVVVHVDVSIPAGRLAIKTGTVFRKKILLRLRPRVAELPGPEVRLIHLSIPVCIRENRRTYIADCGVRAIEVIAVGS